jgi:hypothetical protein
MSAPDHLIKEYQPKLIGKTIAYSESATVRSRDDLVDEQEFPKSKLPPKHRVVGPGSLMTRDFHEDRYPSRHFTNDSLNVHVDDKGKVTHLTQG